LLMAAFLNPKRPTTVPGWSSPIATRKASLFRDERTFLREVIKNASIFSVSFGYYWALMPKSKTAPLLVIIAGVLVAGGIAVYLSRQGSSANDVADASYAVGQTTRVR